MLIIASILQEAFLPLTYLLGQFLLAIHSVLGPAGWGVAIVALAFVFQGLMLPLTLNSRRLRLLRARESQSQRQRRTNNRKARQIGGMTRLYRENKVNPFTALLAIPLYLAVLISMFFVLKSADLKKHICGSGLKAHRVLTSGAIEATTCGHVTPHAANFLFVPDLTARATGTALAVLLLLFLASEYALIFLFGTDLKLRVGTVTALGSPLVFAVLLLFCPAGFVIYWISANAFDLGAVGLIRLNIRSQPAHQKHQAGARKSARNQTSGQRSNPRQARAGNPQSQKKKVKNRTTSR